MQQIVFGNRLIKTERPAFVMGIVNATPDSFYEESRGGLNLALKMIDEGADILDIGGESTRPGFTPVSEAEEIERVIPIIKEIRKKSDIPLSVDTTKTGVFKAAFENGADVWNDTSALNSNEQGAAFLASSKAGIILMHNGSGNIEKVNAELSDRIDFCLKHGISGGKIIVDPGIGFGKTNEECINLINNLNLLCDGKFPVLMALSRKRCIGFMTNKDTDERLYGTLGANLISVQKGASIIRVHDCSAAIDVLNVMKYLK